jgi:endoglucanase
MVAQTREDVLMRVARLITAASLLALAIASPLAAQQRAPAAPALTLGEQAYFEAPGVNWLVFSNWYDGLFADSKISGVELIHRDVRTATNGDVRLSATPGQWDAIGRLVDRKVDRATGAVEATLEYPDHGFRYVVRAEPRGGALRVTVTLPAALPAALTGKAGFNLEFLPSAYWHHSYMADGRSGTFPLHPNSPMQATAERNAASGRADGPGAEPLPMAAGRTLVLAPEDATRRVTIAAADGTVELFDGRNQAQNGWFVARQLLPAGRTGVVLDWTLTAAAAPGWLRPPVIGHSQLGYTPGEAKIATIERDPRDRRPATVRLLKVAADGSTRVAASGPATPWGRYLRYDYARFDFSRVREPGTYLLEMGETRTAPFRIAADLYADAWAPSSDVYLPVAMDHMFVNEAYRVWHGDPHRDDARQAPLNHEHIDLYRQGPTTDTKFEPGEHIPGLAVGGWLDAGDFDIRTQTQYAVIRSLVDTWEAFRPARDTVSVDPTARRVELHVPDGKADILQQIRHGAVQLVAQVDAVGHAIHGIVEPDVAQYTHLGDASTKTDGLIHDAKLAGREPKDGRSGVPDDRWAFTSRASALDYGSAAGMAAAARALRGFDDAFAARALAAAVKLWEDQQRRGAPDAFQHGNTTGGPLDSERMAAAVELLLATGEPRYAAEVERLWPAIRPHFARDALTVLKALPRMSPAFRAEVENAARGWAAEAAKLATANPYGVPITTGGWAGNGAVIDHGLTAYALHRAFPAVVGPDAVFRSLAYLYGTHPGSNLSLVSAVGTQSKEVAYGNNRADFSFIAGGVVPGTLLIKPDLLENKDDWPFLWGENEYVVPPAADYIQLSLAAAALAAEAKP